MENKFLLYIDILGFSQLVDSEQRTKELYSIIDSLNVHTHGYFQTIVFSDTIVVYNKEPAEDKKTAEYVVWYATEFAEDLHYRLIDKNIYFRALLTYGEFEHYNLRNIECFFGKSLVHAHNSEKNIPITGLLIDNKCHEYLRFFRTEVFTDEWRFVYLDRSFDSLEKMMYGSLPIRREIFMQGENVPFLISALEFIKGIYKNMRSDESPNVRAKYLTTWDFYHRRYPEILDALVKSDFSPNPLCPNFNWDQMISQYKAEK